MPLLRSLALVLAGLAGLAGPSTAAQPAGPGALASALPPEGLDKASVLVFRDQRSLDAHYFLADDSVLGLRGDAEAVFAEYRTGAGRALLLMAVYRSGEESLRVFGDLGRQFFSDGFDPKGGRHVERIETGDYAAAALKGKALVVVLEAPDRASCEDLLRRAEAGAAGLSDGADAGRRAPPA